MSRPRRRYIVAEIIVAAIGLLSLIFQWALHPSYGEFIFVALIMSTSLVSIAIAAFRLAEQETLLPHATAIGVALLLAILSLIVLSDWNIGP